MRMTGRTQEQVDAAAATEARQQKREEARARLRDTDWYVVRLMETGRAIPPAIITERAEKRVEADE